MGKKTGQPASERVKLSKRRVDKFQCPPEKSQAFLWDDAAPGFGLRVTRNGKKAYIFQGRLGGSTMRLTIGAVEAWAIDAARKEARRLQSLVDSGRDPRQVKAETIAADVAKRGAVKLAQTPALEIWQEYIEARAPKWGDRHRADHDEMSQAGGQPKKPRGAKKGRPALTQPGILYGLLQLPLASIDRETVAAWAEKESRNRPARTRLALSLLSAFIGWCADNPLYRGQVHADACLRLKRELPKQKISAGVLQREMVKPWFGAVAKLSSPTQSVFLQLLLLLGCRKNELAKLRWQDVDFQWRTIWLNDKVDAENGRTIPLTPYVAHLLESIKPVPVHALRGTTAPKPSPWVFPANSRTGHIAAPTAAHNRALQAAGLPPLSLHDLRRSYATLSEWTQAPAGVAAQIQGHRASALRERHYIRRPVDLLRVWADEIERWILEQAGIEQPQERQDAKQAAGGQV